MSACIFIKIKCHIKISSRSFISFPPPNDEKFWRYGLIKQCLQDIFSFRNLITHIVCRHYIHMMHTKFLQETNQMINTGRDLVFLIYLDKYQLGFILSYVRALRSRTLHIYQGLSCIWRHNNARIIISLAWFHNLFLWDFCHFRGNRLKQSVLNYYATDSPKANPYFLPLIYWGLTRFRRGYLNSQFMLFFKNNYPS